MRGLLPSVAVAALLLAGFALHRALRAEAALRAWEHTPAAAGDTGEVELGVHMGRIQRYHQKWWLAGRAGNSELAAFYLHEMGEEMVAVAEAGVVEDGIDVGVHMRAHGLPVLRELERRLKAEGVAAAHSGAVLLVNACNSCHAATGHPFIRVRVPSDAHFPDQDFQPAP